MRILPDINALAIQLIDDHPGRPYIADHLVPALEGTDTLLSFYEERIPAFTPGVNPTTLAQSLTDGRLDIPRTSTLLS